MLSVRTLLASAAIALSLGGCVSRARYLEALLVGEAAASEAAAARSDLDDAAERYASVRENLSRVEAAFEAERARAYALLSAQVEQRQHALRERTLQALLVDSLRRHVVRLEAQCRSELASAEADAAGLRELYARIFEDTKESLSSQLTLAARDGELVVRIREDAIFVSPVVNRISANGKAALANLAKALGSREDLLVEVHCFAGDKGTYARTLIGARERASTVVGRLVQVHGLRPGTVRAIGTRIHSNASDSTSYGIVIDSAASLHIIVAVIDASSG